MFRSKLERWFVVRPIWRVWAWTRTEEAVTNLPSPHLSQATQPLFKGPNKNMPHTFLSSEEIQKYRFKGYSLINQKGNKSVDEWWGALERGQSWAVFLLAERSSVQFYVISFLIGRIKGDWAVSHTKYSEKKNELDFHADKRCWLQWKKTEEAKMQMQFSPWNELQFVTLIDQPTPISWANMQHLNTSN